ncbi:MAG TPA: Ppx/GppA phosphatase family protein [Gordonia sp. (in: high G+C Gram-positive bacteria)]|uniref:Ppx/GppA phosphatase family protein n=1 Tax=unclassified Gordonia (in: high G+C Gram-positive bacteria) TaxID=2657482 RepID=UPI000FA5282A|nr:MULTISPECIES: Ppx/GppA phosphatase family protein [unclassified Gordonia (in: high G+C Gram-positive bacteria)]RUP35994.1 MAG: Ppx/GppA family phosphatase [Gordonia sp. (in: high G+C Gram-positive bacteria)]HNP55670.1 Ppx/GppA phosphatase family protein [Gordonia sp. (in: high G+C Gram-positive bacteria)]HRC52317.1 Ppx/GppA phosphatase family protein [Gordonia sp. (in: high G+C Gram-positive bacteria)]
MTRVGAVDCGTNSIRLLIADGVEAPGGPKLRDLHREMVVVRLGQGVDATGCFADEAIERTRVALARYASTMRELGVERVDMVATSATRDAGNRDEFFAMTAELLSTVEPGAVARVISGDEEARLSFRGAVGDLDPALGPFAVTDLGGGSTELVVGDASGVRAAYSADVGCVRTTERCLRGDPPSDEEIAAAQEFIAQRLAPAFEAVDVSGVRTWVGVAGTMTTLAALVAGLDEYDPTRIHLSQASLTDLHRVCWDLVAMTREQRAALGVMHPGRVDVIGAGALVTDELSRQMSSRSGVTELVVSEHDILDGIALNLLD